jgi:alpha-galactosidase
MRMRKFIIVLAGVLCVRASAAGFNFVYDSNQLRWDLSNDVIHAAFQLDSSGRFGLLEMDHLANGVTWKSPAHAPASPIRARLGATTYDSTTSYKLLSQSVESPDANTQRQVILLQDLKGTADIRLDLEMTVNQPVLRYRTSLTNLGSRTAYATLADLLPWNFSADAQTFRLWRVAQWAVAPKPTDFQATQVTLATDGTTTGLSTGSGGTFCTWLALRDEKDRGLFAGWEFDGLAQASAAFSVPNDTLALGATLDSLYHPVAAGATFTLPYAFVGLFQGDWDEAGYRTQRFAEAALAAPAPAGFPYVGWDSWGYTTKLDEATLRQNAAIAAKMGIELFILDLGWAREIGDWREDPAKFPSGLRALSDYVHSLGMKFGLHFALAEAMPDAPVLQQNPDWTSSQSYNYFGAQSLCLSNQPTQQWVVQQALSMIDNYNVDWILQDGQNMVKKCTKTTHTHDPRDSNYANAVDGIDAVVQQVRSLRPNVMWENCEDGGSMMTFSMLSRYVTSITNDASGALGSRQGAYGATYPFPPRYADRYMPEDPSNTYVTRSYMFGGPWHLMNALPSMAPTSAALATSEIAVYKTIRGEINAGMVHHVTSAPATGRTDALESYQAVGDTAVAIVTRENSTDDYADIKIEGLQPAKTYAVHFQDDPRTLSMTGRQLSQTGVRVNLSASQSAEIVYVAPM